MKLKAWPFSRYCTLADRLTVPQRAYNDVAYDGLQPVDLDQAQRAAAHEIFGAIATVSEVARRVVVQVKGRDVGGSRFGAERCAHLGLTLAVDRIGLQELAYVVFGGPKLRHARVGLRHARTSLKHHGVAIQEDSSDGFTITRPDGRRIRFEAFAASRGGDTVRGVPIVAALLDEAGFYFDEASGVANGEAIFGAIIPRLLPGGQILIVSSPWAESGLLYTEFSRNFGAPVTALAALCPTGLMRDDAETLAMIATERERDPENARRELDAEFMPTGSGHYFDRFAVGRCAVASAPLLVSPPHTGWWVLGGYDPAYVRDAAEGGVIRYNGTRFELVELFTRVPTKGQPLVPSQVDREFAEIVAKHGGWCVITDGHYRESVREHVQGAGLQLWEGPAAKPDVFARARDLIHSNAALWSEGHRRLTRQLSEIVGRPLPGGSVSISSPRKRGDHGDAAHAFCLALWAASLSQGDPNAAYNQWAERFNSSPIAESSPYDWDGYVNTHRYW